MFDEIIAALEARSDLLGWSARHVTSRGAQLYSVPNRVECVRRTLDERYVVEVLRDTTQGDAANVGAGNVTLLPGDDIRAGIEAAALRSSLVHNRPYSLPGPAPLPDVPLADASLSGDMEEALDKAFAILRQAANAEAGVRMTAAELFADEATIRLRNSRGIDATQTGTSVAAEWVLLAQNDGRRGRDLRRDDATPAGRPAAGRGNGATRGVDTRPADGHGLHLHHQGAVVLRDAVLAEFMNAGVIQTLGSASQKFAGASTWEVGKSVLPEGRTGDPLTVWANRQLPYGVGANRFDAEGIPAQRLALIQDNVLQAFERGPALRRIPGHSRDRRFRRDRGRGGKPDAADLLAEPHVEVAAFSWFNPDEITGDFACEIRLGYVVDGGKRTPFKGGQLIGNYLQALAGARWSSETGFYGAYQGPTTVRFDNLTVAA